MQIIDGIAALKKHHSGQICLALGNFDGVHLGHQKILQATIALAKAKGKKSAVLLFVPHPLTVLFPQHAPKLLLPLEDRIAFLGKVGIDYVIIHPFTKEFAVITPESFVQQVLAAELNVAAVVVGFDYSFGHRGKGTPSDLVKLSKKYGFCVQVIEPVKVDNEIVGSSAIRAYLAQGLVQDVQRLLGYTYFLRGIVVHGDGRGRKLGFPTANLQVNEQIMLPAHGVYLTQVVAGDMKAWALTNIGRRPTFHKKDTTVEIHLLDQNKNLYQKELIVYFLHRMREEKAFQNAAELVQQICQDVQKAQHLIRSYTAEGKDFSPFSC
ncbi:MAG: bifunctional riboflavin kinase/FAD synthetase [Firmicutes bacterium]|nr:bifunctional riboflavin kinase/FAD synthetase [Bacillota bacterium]